MLIIIALQIAIIIWLLRYLHRGDTGPKEPAHALFVAALLGVLAVVAAGILEGLLLPKDLNKVSGINAGTISTATLAVGCISIGVIEELAKALPVARFLRRKPYFNEVSDGIIYFATAGLLFGALENIGYAFTYGTATGLARVITMPFLHAGFTAIIGYAIARHRFAHTSSVALLGGFISAIGLHALYDFAIFTRRPALMVVSIAIAVFANFTVFRLYKRSKKDDATLAATAQS